MSASSCRLTLRCVVRIGLLCGHHPDVRTNPAIPGCRRRPCPAAEATPARRQHPIRLRGRRPGLPITAATGSGSSTRTGRATIRSRPTRCRVRSSWRTGPRTGRGSSSRRGAGRRSRSTSTIWRRRPPASSLPVRPLPRRRRTGLLAGRHAGRLHPCPGTICHQPDRRKARCRPTAGCGSGS